MSNLQVTCSSCGEHVSAHAARLSEDSEFETDVAAFRYFCPVCFIQAKNAAMQAGMLNALKATPLAGR